MQSTRNDSPRPTITFTFDDGYRDNCEFAIPLMLEHHIPCVYFASVANVVQQTPFQHDLKAGTPLAINTAAELREIADHGIEIGLHTRNHVDFSRVHDPETVRAETMAFLDTLTDADLDKPSHAPEEMKEWFGTIGQCLAVAPIHFGFHGGQIADARRAAGRQPVLG